MFLIKCIYYGLSFFKDDLLNLFERRKISSKIFSWTTIDFDVYMCKPVKLNSLP